MLGNNLSVGLIFLFCKSISDVFFFILPDVFYLQQ